MKKKLLASVFVVFMLASTTPIFAVNTANTNNTAALNTTQLAKLNETQTKLTNLVANITSLQTTYKNVKNKGLLVALEQFKKQAKLLNNEITLFIKHPTKNADKKIDSFVNREAQLEKKVNNTATVLNKTQNITNKTNKTGNHTTNTTNSSQ